MRRLALAALIAMLTVAALPGVAEANNHDELALPFPAHETWTMDGPNGTTRHHGGYDLTPPPGSPGHVLAVADGLAAAWCSEGPQTLVLLYVEGHGLFEYGHIASASLPAHITEGNWVAVNQLDYLGTLWVNPTGSYGWEDNDRNPDGSAKCFEGQTPYVHLHINTPYAGPSMSGQILGWAVNYSGNLAAPNPAHAPPAAAPPLVVEPEPPAETVEQWWARLFPEEA